MFDLESNLSGAEIFDADAGTGDQYVDLLGYKGACLFLKVSAIGTDATVTFYDADASPAASGSYSAVSDDELSSSGNTPSSGAITVTANGLYKIGYSGNSRYLRMALSFTGGTPAFDGFLVAGFPHNAPVDSSADIELTTGAVS